VTTASSWVGSKYAEASSFVSDTYSTLAGWVSGGPEPSLTSDGAATLASTSSTSSSSLAYNDYVGLSQATATSKLKASGQASSQSLFTG
jgi:hypothetical protein